MSSALSFVQKTSREIIVSESTKHPNAAWVEEQAERFLDQSANRDPDEKPAIVLHDNDTKFCKDFTNKLKSRGSVAPHFHSLIGDLVMVDENKHPDYIDKYLIIHGPTH